MKKAKVGMNELKEEVAELINCGLDNGEIAEVLSRSFSLKDIISVIREDIESADSREYKVVELGVIVEVGIPKAKAAKYKTEKGLHDYADKIICEFVQKVQYFGEFWIANNSYGYNGATEINNFGYFYSNERRRSKSHRVFRHIGTNLFVYVPVETSFSSNNDLLDLFNTYRYEYKGCVIEMQGASLKESHNQESLPEGMIIEKGQVKGR